MNALNQERTSMNGPVETLMPAKKYNALPPNFVSRHIMKVDGTTGIVHGCRDSVSNFEVDSKGTV